MMMQGPQVGLDEAIRGFAPPIRTSRLTLRPTRVDDGARLFAAFADWEVVRWLSSAAWPQDRALFLESLAGLDEDRRLGACLYLSVVLEGSAVGVVVVANAGSTAEIGYWIGRRHWRRGYMAEAVSAVCEWIFGASDTASIVSSVFFGNEASLRLQSRLGFSVVRHASAYSLPCDGYMDRYETRLDRADFRPLARTVSV